MRLGILNEGGFGTKLLFILIRLFSRQPVPDAARLTFYRPDFYGSYSKALTHEAMRGPSAWSIAERELMAAYVSNVNDCPFCIGAHTATATQASGNEVMVAAALADLESAPVEDRLRATLRMLGRLTRDGHLSAEDVRAVLDTGVSRQQVEDALAICYAFNVTNRLANAFGFEVLSQEGFQAGARYLLRRGYR
ncbi:MAG TPA: carboxymuconolactone decarboxylase family protein [Chloroflexota bacterium]|nr:carboxymuconolactone decarboxylase family protein [Chloroflexota bacterium]